MLDLAGKRVFVAGHRGMVGRALVRRLAARGLRDPHRRPRRGSTCAVRRDVEAGWPQLRPDAVFLAAAKVGGILANDSYPADFLYDNLMIEANVIEARASQRRRASCCSSARRCIYPQARAAADHRGRAADRPAGADQRVVRDRQDRRHQAVPGLSPPVRLRLHLRACRPTSTAPATISTCTSSHVLPALIRKAHEAKLARRADAGGLGQRHAAARVPARRRSAPTRWSSWSRPIRRAGHRQCRHRRGSLDRAISRSWSPRWSASTGEIRFDATKPDGTPRKLVDSRRLDALGWSCIRLREGVEGVYRWFRRNYGSERRQPAALRVEVPETKIPVVTVCSNSAATI